MRDKHPHVDFHPDNAHAVAPDQRYAPEDHRDEDGDVARDDDDADFEHARACALTRMARAPYDPHSSEIEFG